MKKAASILLTVLILSLTACSRPDNRLADAEERDDAQSAAITTLDEGVWPANDYTAGLPEPSGTVAWATLDSRHGYCSVSMADMSETDFHGYLDRLKQAGFSVVKEVSEEIKGQGYVSVGTLMSDGEKWLSISYLPNCFTIYISFKK